MPASRQHQHQGQLVAAAGEYYLQSDDSVTAGAVVSYPDIHSWGEVCCLTLAHWHRTAAEQQQRSNKRHTTETTPTIHHPLQLTLSCIRDRTTEAEVTARLGYCC